MRRVKKKAEENRNLQYQHKLKTEDWRIMMELMTRVEAREAFRQPALGGLSCGPLYKGIKDETPAMVMGKLNIFVYLDTMPQRHACQCTLQPQCTYISLASVRTSGVHIS